MQVKEILRVKGNRLLSVEPSESATQAVRTMAEQNLGSLVVLERGRMVGMLTFHEIMEALAARRSLFDRVGGLRAEVSPADVLRTRVGKPSPGPPTNSFTAPEKTAARLMSGPDPKHAPDAPCPATPAPAAAPSMPPTRAPLAVLLLCEPMTAPAVAPTRAPVVAARC